MSDNSTRTAAILIIGAEILSGRTVDKNLSFLASWLGEIGVDVCEARVVADESDAIVGALQELRQAYDYVFTTGGIGPTHDDITAECVARAFGRGLQFHPDAMAILKVRYGERFNDARKRMARVPEGATLIDNPASAAPGFQIDNVFVLAGVPQVVRAMMEGLRDRSEGGQRVQSVIVGSHVLEGDVAEGLARIQAHFPDVAIGSYPFFHDGKGGVNIVARAADGERRGAVTAEVKALLKELGADAVPGGVTH